MIGGQGSLSHSLSIRLIPPYNAERAMKGSLWESYREGSLSPSLFAQLIYSHP